MKIGQIIKLSIPHFRKDRYYLVYQIVDTDFIILNITDRDKRSSIKTEIPQYELRTKIYHDIISFINLNTKVLVDYELLSELIDKFPQQNEKGKPLPRIFKDELDEISKAIDKCFNNSKFKGNRYEIRIV